MSIEKEISRILIDRDKIRTKLNELGIEPNPKANLDECATKLQLVEDNGAVSAQVKEGETYKIPKGYHNGAGTVSGVAGGGSYNLQSKTITPSTEQQDVTPDPGFYGLSDVMVKAIPEKYKDVTGVTATDADVLANKIIVTAAGPVAGKMPNNGAISQVLDTSTASYTVPAGYHDGKGSVKITLEEKTISPTKKPQSITPTPGKVLSKVTVNAIPAELIDTTDADALAGEILAGKFAYADGVKLEGTMPNNGATTKTIDGLVATSVTIPAGYTSGGTVSLTNDIETALAAI